jgi:hypothetical protein
VGPQFAVFAVSLICLGACAGQTVLVDNPPNQSNAPVATFDQHGIRFDYPGTWAIFQTPPPPSPSAGQPAIVDPRQQSIDIVGLDDLNNVSVAYGTSQVEGDDFGAWSERIKANLSEAVSARMQTLLAGPEEIRAAGYQALRYEVRTPSGLGYLLEVTWVGFVRGTTQFVIQCQSVPREAAEIQRGCQQVLATLQVGIAGG